MPQQALCVQQTVQGPRFSQLVSVSADRRREVAGRSVRPDLPGDGVVSRLLTLTPTAPDSAVPGGPPLKTFAHPLFATSLETDSPT